MKRRMICLAAMAATLFGAGTALAQAPAAKPIRIILVGDSTMATRSGYGDAFCARVKPEVKCINLARGGRSSSSFRAEGRWTEVQELLRNGGQFSATYVLIQFGHNDQPGKPGRTTDLVTEFPVNLTRYARETKELGGVPVMVTPLTRRTFEGPILKNDLRPWAAAALAVAAAEHVPALDLNAISYAAVQAMGQAEADTLAMEPPPAAGASVPPPVKSNGTAEPQGAPKSSFDRTHLGAKGAPLFAAMVAHELARVAPATAAAFKPDN